MASHSSLVPFANGKNATEFGRAVVEKLIRHVGELREKVIPAENIANMRHGHGWTFQQQRKEGFAAETGEFKVESTETSFHYDRMLSGDINLVHEFISSMAQKMNEKMMEGLTTEISDTCDRFGLVSNVPKGGSIAYSILQGMSEIRASVDQDGTVSLPQLMLSPETMERLNKEMAIYGPHLERKAAKIRAEVEQEARKQEEERLSKFEQQ